MNSVHCSRCVCVCVHCSRCVCVCVCVSTAPGVCVLGWVKYREHISLNSKCFSDARLLHLYCAGNAHSSVAHVNAAPRFISLH